MPNTHITETETHLRSLAHDADQSEFTSDITEWRPGTDPGAEADAACGVPSPAETQPAAEAAAEVSPAPETAAPDTTDAEAAAFHKAWGEHVAREIEATPELGNPTSELSRTVQGILNETPLFAKVPDGFRHAAALARAKATAETVPALQARIDTLTKENQRLSRLTSISGSPPVRSSREIEPALNERDLRRLAREADEEG